ncbi:MAG: acetate kinase, partial [Desulfofundulus sp.]
MHVLVMNCGSSSVKYRLYDMSNETVLASGLAERIGFPDSRLTQQVAGKDKESWTFPMPDHQAAIEAILARLTHGDCGVAVSPGEI